MKRSFLPAALVALAIAVVAPVPAWAELGQGASGQQGPGQQGMETLPPESPPNDESRPNDGELSNFVAAFVRLIGVQHGYMVMMQDERDPHRMEAIKRNALDDMTAAVEQDGLSVDRYNEIALAVREDPGLQDRVEAILQQLASDPSAEQAAPEEE